MNGGSPEPSLDTSGSLSSWGEIESIAPWASILLGNGASCAVWQGFEYPSLFERAQSDDLPHQLTASDLTIFTNLKTHDFERVLETLKTTEETAIALGYQIPGIADRYESIKLALIETVQSVHPPWAAIPEKVLIQIGQHLQKYTNVYSTNYDLLMYWARMSVNDGKPFKDFLWFNEFSLADTEVQGGYTRVYHLHGALHLYRKDNRTRKRSRQPGETLLEQFEKIFKEGGIPLFVSEGTADAKMEMIRQFDYLSFAYRQFSTDHEPLVVLGHSLQDQHITEAMIKHLWGRRQIAISLLPGDPEAIQKAKVAFHGVLPASKAELFFFDSTTHPLGDPALKIPPD